MGPAYRIHTRRLVIRCWTPADAAWLKSAIDESLEHLRPWMPWAADEPQEIEAKIVRLRRFKADFDQGRDFVYGVFDREETRVIGGSGLHTRLGKAVLEIGYWVHKDHINQGIATESSAALTRVAMEIDKVKRVEIHCNQNNAASAAIPRKLGFDCRFTVTDRADGPRDTMIWTMSRENYPGSPASSNQIQAFGAGGNAIELRQPYRGQH